MDRPPYQKAPPVNVPQHMPAAPRVSPAWLMRLRGLLAVPVALALVLGAPGLAYAAFSAKTAASLSVGTYKIPAPASINGSLQCMTVRGQKGAVITFTDFAEVARATGYTATLISPNGSKTATGSVEADTSRVVLLFGSGNGSGTYTFRLTAKVGSWTGAALQQTVTC